MRKPKNYAALARRASHAAGPCIVVRVAARTRKGYMVHGIVAHVPRAQRCGARASARTLADASDTAFAVVRALRAPMPRAKRPS